MTDSSLASMVYSTAERNTVILLVVGGFLSLISLLLLFGFMIFMGKTYAHTHFQVYFVCLLLANTMQAWGTIMSLKWVQLRGIFDGSFCHAQGGIKQGGNIGFAVWSFVISVHLFNLLFLRFKTPKAVSWAIVALGWCFIFSIVFLGPVAIENRARGRYFGISGLWCWITPAYRTEQIWLEYFFHVFALGCNFVLHTATLLRVRGNLLHVGGRWRLRRGAPWELALGRDFTDSAMLRVVQHMIWYPVAYAVMVLPVAVVRLVEFCGGAVPLWAGALAGTIYGLSGFVNVMLFLGVRRLFPEPDAIPDFTDRKGEDVEAIVAQHGVVPFMLTRPVESERVSSSSESVYST